MVNRLRKVEAVQAGNGESAGFAVHKRNKATQIDYGAAGGHIVNAEGMPPVLHVRKRFTIAQVNAGAEILPAKIGHKYRMVSARAIAIGGAVGATTTVDILATASAASRKLVAFAQASLLQSAVLQDGAAGAAVLADGASYTQNDVNTAVNIGKTGANLTTATHVDILISFVLEKA